MSGENKITGETSDGYHTFNELYDHRCLLWINYCLTNPQGTYLVHDHFDGWFLLGKETIVGQISYHCPNKYIDLVMSIDQRHPEFDGHTSQDVIERLIKLTTSRNIRSPIANNGVSLHEITELVSALEDMINYYKPHNWVSTETGYEVLNKAQKVLSKLQPTAPRGGGEIKHADNCPSVKGAPVCTCEHLRRYS